MYIYIIYCFILCKHFSFCSIKTISRLLLLFQNKNNSKGFIGLDACSARLRCLVTDQSSTHFGGLCTQIWSKCRGDREIAYGRGLSSCLWLHASGMTWGSEVLGGSWLGTNLRNGTLEICKMLMILALPLPGRFSLPGRSKWSVPLGILTSRPRYPWLLFNVWLLANGSRDFHQVWLQKY